MEEEERAYLEARERELNNMTEAASKEMADHLTLKQKPIGVPTESEIQRVKPVIYGPDGQKAN